MSLNAWRILFERLWLIVKPMEIATPENKSASDRDRLDYQAKTMRRGF
jgi:hypothetical protein